MAKTQVKIEPLLVFVSEIKIDLTLKKSNFLFLLCFEIAINQFITMSPVITKETQYLFLPILRQI